jgi:hypothetical protein
MCAGVPCDSQAVRIIHGIHASAGIEAVRVFEEEGNCIFCLEMRADELMRHLISGELANYRVVRTSPKPLQKHRGCRGIDVAKHDCNVPRSPPGFSSLSTLALLDHRLEEISSIR